MGGCVGVGVVGLYHQAFGAAHQAPGCGQGRDPVAVVGEAVGPVGEHFPRADGVELLDVGEQDDPDAFDLGVHGPTMPGPPAVTFTRGG